MKTTIGQKVNERFMSTAAILLLSWGLLISALGQDGSLELPRPVTDADFVQVKTRSPFLRTLNLSDTYLLRAVVSMGEESLATLYNRDTKETVLISTTDEDRNGLKLIGVSSADELGKVSVKVSVGGEEVELKYDEKSVAPVGKGKSSGSRGGTSGGSSSHKHKGPAPEEVKRYKSLSPEKQKKFHEYIKSTMKKYPNVSREERGNMIRGALIRLTDGHDVEVPKDATSTKR